MAKRMMNWVERWLYGLYVDTQAVPLLVKAVGIEQQQYEIMNYKASDMLSC